MSRERQKKPYSITSRPIKSSAEQESIIEKQPQSVYPVRPVHYHHYQCAIVHTPCVRELSFASYPTCCRVTVIGDPLAEYLRAFVNRLRITWPILSASTSTSTGSPGISKVRAGPVPAVYSSIKFRQISTRSQRLRCSTNMFVSISEVSNRSFTSTSIRCNERSISSSPILTTSAESAFVLCR